MASHEHDEYRRSISELQERTLTLRSSVKDVEKGVSNVRQDLSVVADQMASFETGQKRLRSKVTELEDTMGVVRSSLDAMVKSMAASRSSLETLADEFTGEVKEEKERADSVQQGLTAIRHASTGLRDALESGLARATGQLEEICEGEENLRKLFSEAAQRVSGLVDGLDRQLRAQLTEIEEHVEQIRDQEWEGLEKTEESFGKLGEQQGRMAEALEKMGTAGQGLAESLALLSSRQIDDEDASTLGRAAAKNLAAVRVLASGQPETAVERLRDACELAPEALEPRYNLAVALLRAGRANEGAGIARALCEEFDDDPRVHLLGGWLDLHAGKADSALDRFRTGLARAPGDPDLLLGLAVGELQRERPRDALKALRQAREAGGGEGGVGGPVPASLAELMEELGAPEPGSTPR